MYNDNPHKIYNIKPMYFTCMCSNPHKSYIIKTWYTFSMYKCMCNDNPLNIYRLKDNILYFYTYNDNAYKRYQHNKFINGKIVSLSFYMNNHLPQISINMERVFMTTIVFMITCVMYLPYVWAPINSKMIITMHWFGLTFTRLPFLVYFLLVLWSYPHTFTWISHYRDNFD